MKWTPKIHRGSTFHTPVTVLDCHKEPVSFLDTTFSIVPDDELYLPIDLTPGNGKLTITEFVWKSVWNASTNYSEGDVVRYGAYLWIAKQANSGVIPIGGDDWTPFATFWFLISDVETASYLWESAAYNWAVTRGNGDIEEAYLTGIVDINGPT